MKHLIGKRLLVACCVAALSVLFFGGIASAQMTSDPDSPDGKPTTLGADGNDGYKLYFSPRFYLTLGCFPNLFGLFDNGLAKTKLGCGGKIKPYFEGTPFNMTTLDAVDKIKKEDPDGGGEKLMFFSVREDIYLTDGGTPFFVRAGDVAILNMNDWSFKAYFQPHNINLVNTDACAVIPANGGSEKKPLLVFSPSHNWFYTGPGTPYFFRDEDLAIWDPNSGMVKPFIWGADLGIYSLDAVDVMTDGVPEGEFDKLFFSIRIPQWVYPAYGEPFYMRDGDVAVVDLNNSDAPKYKLALKGNMKFIYTIDAISVRKKDSEE